MVPGTAVGAPVVPVAGDCPLAVAPAGLCAPSVPVAGLCPPAVSPTGVCPPIVSMAGCGMISCGWPETSLVSGGFSEPSFPTPGPPSPVFAVSSPPVREGFSEAPGDPPVSPGDPPASGAAGFSFPPGNDTSISPTSPGPSLPLERLGNLGRPIDDIAPKIPPQNGSGLCSAMFTSGLLPNTDATCNPAYPTCPRATQPRGIFFPDCAAAALPTYTPNLAPLVINPDAPPAIAPPTAACQTDLPSISSRL